MILSAALAVGIHACGGGGDRLSPQGTTGTAPNCVMQATPPFSLLLVLSKGTCAAVTSGAVGASGAGDGGDLPRMERASRRW